MDGPIPIDSCDVGTHERTTNIPSSTPATKRSLLLLPSWTPNTTRLLLAGGASAWDILDHVIQDGDNTHFVNALCTELQTTGLLDDLRPARTKGDVQIDNMLSLVRGRFDNDDNDNNNNHAPENTGLIPTRSDSIRGDMNTWISREYRSHDDFEHVHPCLSQLVNRIQETAQHHLSPHNIILDLSLTSVQLAVYPGDGISCYLRHCDRGDGQCQEESSSHPVAPSSPTIKRAAAERIVTAVYYLTPTDWNAELDGGCLRLFSSDNDTFYDVVPYANRFVVFRSDGVEHEVLPSLRRNRMALTIWLYGWVQPPTTTSPPNHDSLVRTIDQETVNTSPASTQEEASVNSMDGPPPPLPLLESDAAAGDQESIFVSIAAYRDSETGPTIRSLMTTARHPARVYVGVVLQIDTQTDNDVHILDNLPQDAPWYASNVRYLTLDARHAQGPCYARYLCQTLHRDEDYVLQIDSHMRFRQNWDTYLIQQLQKCPGGDANKSMLTTYPVGYDLPDKFPNETRGTLLVPWKFNDTGMLRQKGRLMMKQPTTSTQDSSVVPCLLYAAGFNFARASVLQDCPYDGKLCHLFFGEELSMAVRLYTHGYDLYAPSQSVCYHLWSRAHRPSPLLDLATSISSGTADWQKQQRNASLQVVRQQLRGQGRGLGSVRTATEFADALGVNFETQSISSNAALGGLPPEAFVLNDYQVVAPQGLEQKNVVLLASRPKELIASFLGNLQ